MGMWQPSTAPITLGNCAMLRNCSFTPVVHGSVGHRMTASDKQHRKSTTSFTRTLRWPGEMSKRSAMSRCALWLPRYHKVTARAAVTTSLLVDISVLNFVLSVCCSGLLMVLISCSSDWVPIIVLAGYRRCRGVSCSLLDFVILSNLVQSILLMFLWYIRSRSDGDILCTL